MKKIRKSFSHGRTKQAVMEVMENRKRGLKTATIPVQTKTTTPEQAQADIDAWINSPEFAEECRKEEEKQKRAEERRLAREAELEAAREERRRNPKSPLDAYYNHMDNCPYGWWEDKKRRAWKKVNPTFKAAIQLRQDPALDGLPDRLRWQHDRDQERALPHNTTSR